MRIIILFLSVFLTSCATHGGTDFSERKIKTFVGLKEQNIVMQKYDFSCGIAALLTLMKYHFGDEVKQEKEVLTSFLDSLPKKEKEKVMQDGLSVLHLEKLSKKLGYRVWAMRLKKEALLKLDRPVLVYLETDDFKHFSVVRGIREDRIFLADSSYGNIKMSLPIFLERWKGNIVVILDKPTNIKKLEITDSEIARPEIKLIQTMF